MKDPARISLLPVRIGRGRNVGRSRRQPWHIGINTCKNPPL